jgi:hypothetical protein
VTTHLHRYSVALLSPEAEERFLRRVLTALGFQPSRQESPIGLSGLQHSSLLTGVSTTAHHIVLCQTGFQQVFAAPRVARIGQSSPPPGDSRALREREEQLRRDILFSGYDLKGRFEAEGWTCDLLCFLNLSSPEEGGSDLLDFTLRRQRSGLAPIDIQSTVHQSTDPIAHIPLAELRRNAISTGACFLGLSDLLDHELVSVTQSEESAALETAIEMLKRLRIVQYFRPPTDELLLATLAKSTTGLPQQQLSTAADLSKRLNHPLGDNALLAGVDKDNPLEVALALRKEHLIQYRGKVAYVTESGLQVSHEIEKTAQESWIAKISKLVNLLKSLIALGGTFGGAV